MEKSSVIDSDVTDVLEYITSSIASDKDLYVTKIMTPDYILELLLNLRTVLPKKYDSLFQEFTNYFLILRCYKVATYLCLQLIIDLFLNRIYPPNKLYFREDAFIQMILHIYQTDEIDELLFDAMVNTALTTVP